ncbi:MAG: type II toxin-antitoxin system HicB family antitoxin [Dehalococcoidia bacterium]
MRRYTVILTPDPEDGGYVVTVPTLPGAITQGETIEEALENAVDAIRLVVSNLERHGEPIPEEQGTPIVETVEV